MFFESSSAKAHEAVRADEAAKERKRINQEAEDEKRRRAQKEEERRRQKEAQKEGGATATAATAAAAAEKTAAAEGAAAAAAAAAKEAEDTPEARHARAIMDKVAERKAAREAAMIKARKKEARRRREAGEEEADGLAAYGEGVPKGGSISKVVEGGPFEGIGLSAADVVDECHKMPRVISDAARSDALEELFHRFCCRELDNAEFRAALKELVGAKPLFRMLCTLNPILAVPVVGK